MTAARTLFVALVAMLVVAHGAAAAPEAVVRIQFASVSSAAVFVDYSMDGREADTQRSFLDADQDGNVSEGEAEAGAQHSLQSAQRISGFGLPIGALWMDRQSASLNVSSLRYVGAAGPTRGGPPVHAQWTFQAAFRPQANATHQFGIDAGNMSVSGFAAASVQSILLEAPPGQIFAKGATQIRTVQLLDGGARAAVEGPITRLVGWILFEVREAPPASTTVASPGPPDLLWLALAAGVAYRRRP